MWLTETGKADECGGRSRVFRLVSSDQPGMPATGSRSLQSALLPAAAVTQLQCVTLDHDDDPAWIVVDGDQVLFQLHSRRSTDSALDLTGCWFESATTDRQPEAVELLLNSVLSTATTLDIGELRWLVEDESTLVAPPQLESHGFRPAVRLQEWRAAGLPSLPPDDSIRQFPLTEVSSGSRSGALQELLAECLAGSQDLQQIVKPDPATLMNSWSRLTDGALFLAECDGRLCGLAVVSRDPDGATDWQLALEYLGVAQRSRRQGWARRLLQQVRAVASPDSGPSAADLVVWCDTQNKPAVGLYENSDFTVGDRQTIWSCRPTEVGHACGTVSDVG